MADRPYPEARATYVMENDLEGLPEDLEGFLSFFEGRRTKIEARLRAALNSPSVSS